MARYLTLRAPDGTVVCYRKDHVEAGEGYNDYEVLQERDDEPPDLAEWSDEHQQWRVNTARKLEAQENARWSGMSRAQMAAEIRRDVLTEARGRPA